MFHWLSYLFPSLIWKIKTSEKILYLTFDDGPIPEVTPWVLRELEKYHAKATFFCIGSNVVKNSELFKQLTVHGHRIGNHTQHHLNGWKAKPTVYINNVADAGLHISSHIFRPPYGKITPVIITRLKSEYKIVMWDVLSYDFDITRNGEWCSQHVIRSAKPGSIIVFHDSIKANERLKVALPAVLKYFSAKGFKFHSLPV
ncbi:MAG: polysaccharide deacetylase family protein [Bacteroidota bacterium]